MFRNYVVMAFRTLLKDRLYTLLNLLGLTIGLSGAFLIYTWVSSEQGYDRYHPNGNRIYRVATEWDGNPGEGCAAAFPVIKSRVLNQLPEITTAARIFNTGYLGARTQVRYTDKVFTDDRLYYADPEFLSIFPFRVLQGQASLTAPNAAILTQHTATRYFGDEDPIGKLMTIGSREFQVTGVIEDIPTLTHFNFDILATMAAHPWIKDAEQEVWSGIAFHTYIKVREGVDAAVLQQKIAHTLDQMPDDPDGYGDDLNMVLQPVQDIHLTSHYDFELQPNGTRSSLYLFATIAALILAMASINYINLSTARHTQRIKEVGVRKVMGAFRSQLLMQFLIESIMLVLVSLLLAVVLIETVSPWISGLAGHNLSIRSSYSLVILFACVALVTGIVSGFFPALILSGFRPATLFRPAMATGKSTLRRGLILVQFTISIILMICSIGAYQQMRFIQQTSLGYDKEQTVALFLGFDKMYLQYKPLKALLLQSSAITGATATSQLPSHVQEGEGINIAGNHAFTTSYISVDEDFFKTLNITVKEGGQAISDVHPDTTQNRFVLNEQAVKEMNATNSDVLGREIVIRHGNMKPGPIVGIVSDFHFQSLHHNVGPLVLEFDPSRFAYLLVKIAPGHTPEAMTHIERSWRKIAGETSLDYHFLDDAYDKLYHNEQRLGNLFTIFAGLSTFVALLGLFGLTAFSVDRRTKEIGIRKVLGASTASLSGLLSRDFAGLLIIAFVLAMPAGHYLTSMWLSTFAYKTTIGIWVFVATAVLNAVFVIGIVVYQSVRAAGKNPVVTLRSE